MIHCFGLRTELYTEVENTFYKVTNDS